MDPFRPDLYRVFEYGSRSPDDIERLRQQNAALRGQLEKTAAMVARHSQKAQGIATVVSNIGESKALLAGSGGQIVAALPNGAKLARGAQVLIDSESLQIFETLKVPLYLGAVGTVRELLGEVVMVEAGATAITAVAAEGLTVEPGMRVRLDASNSVVLMVLGREGGAGSSNVSLGVRWEDIGGQEEAKEAIREAIEYPVRFAAVYQAHGQKPSKGVLLYGPPGTGKSLLGKAVATALADGKGAHPDAFIYVKGPEILSKWVGSSEAAVRALFSRCRAHKTATGRPAVLFIDEADALLGHRDGAGLSVSMAQTIVPAFLTEMDGLEDSGAFVMLSTNRPDALDPAVVRDGRIDRRVRIGRPTKDDAGRILMIALRGRKVEEKQAFVEHALKTLHSDDLTLFKLTTEEGMVSLRLRDALSGALLTGLVAKAVEFAIKRNREQGALSDLEPKDFDAAVLLAFREMAHTDHKLLIRERLGTRKLLRLENCFEESVKLFGQGQA